jgi:protein O-mannosyl-transferase
MQEFNKKSGSKKNTILMFSKSNKSIRILICLFLVAVTSLAYYQVLDHEFLNFDDNRYVTENTNITQGLTREAVAWAFTKSYISNWHPMTWLSHMLDFEIYGGDPSGHHLTNLLLHIANTLLLLGVLSKMTGALWRSGLVATLFALHPLNVESVAWVAERKNVLSTFFWLLTMWAYVDYSQKKTVGAYLLVIFFLMLGLMAKPMLVTLPFVLILLDFWPLKRWGWQNTGSEKSSGIKTVLLEKIPLFLLVVGASITTYIAQKNWDAMRSTELRSLYSALTNAVVSYIQYLEKFFFPVKLSVFYPHPGDSLPAWKAIVYLGALVVITTSVLRTVRQAPYLAVGWFWYLGTLVPVIGIVQVGEQAMADRYMYIPLIGVFMAIAWGLPELMKRKVQQNRMLLMVGTLIILLITLTWVQVSYWKNSRALFEHAISINNSKAPSFVIAHNNLGHAMALKGQYEDAVIQYRQAIKINPHFAPVHNNLGVTLNELHRYDEAIKSFQQAINIKSDYAEAHNNLANGLRKKGKVKQAIFYYDKAIRLKSDYAEAHFNLGILLSQQDRDEEAVTQYRRALQIKPDFILAHDNLASLLSRQGDFEGAVSHYQQAINLDPGFSKAHNNLGSTLAGQGRLEEAVIHFEQAIVIDPDYMDAQNNLELARSLVEKNKGPDQNKN